MPWLDIGWFILKSQTDATILRKVLDQPAGNTRWDSFYEIVAFMRGHIVNKLEFTL